MIIVPQTPSHRAPPGKLASFCTIRSWGLADRQELGLFFMIDLAGARPGGRGEGGPPSPAGQIGFVSHVCPRPPDLVPPGPGGNWLCFAQSGLGVLADHRKLGLFCMIDLAGARPEGGEAREGRPDLPAKLGSFRMFAPRPTPLWPRPTGLRPGNWIRFAHLCRVPDRCVPILPGTTGNWVRFARLASMILVPQTPSHRAPPGKLGSFCTNTHHVGPATPGGTTDPSPSFQRWEPGTRPYPAPQGRKKRHPRSRGVLPSRTGLASSGGSDTHR